MATMLSILQFAVYENFLFYIYSIGVWDFAMKFALWRYYAGFHDERKNEHDISMKCIYTNLGLTNIPIVVSI